MPQRLSTAGFILSIIAIVISVLMLTTQFVQIGPLVSSKELKEKVEKLSSQIKTLEGTIKELKQKGGKNMVWEIKSPAFEEGGTVPEKFTGDGKNISPPLSWTSPPEGTKSLALICEDPDAPGGVFTHWIIYNIPPDLTELPEDIPKDKKVESLGGALQGKNDFGDIGYAGPSPPPGKPHRYMFKLYALKESLDLRAGAKRKKFLRAIKKKQIETVQLTGEYGR